MNVRSISVILAFILCGLSTNAHACSSPPHWHPLTDSAANDRADTIFRGIVVDITPPTDTRHTSSRTARLKVLQAMKGDTGTEMDVDYQQANGGNCGTWLEIGDNVWVRAKKRDHGKLEMTGVEGNVPGDATPAVYLGTAENGFPRIVIGDFNQPTTPVTTVNNFTIPFVDPAGPKIDPACLKQTADQYRWWRISVDQRGKITRVRSRFSMNPAREEAATKRAREILEAPRFLPGRINDIPAEMEIVVADLDYTCGRSK